MSFCCCLRIEHLDWLLASKQAWLCVEMMIHDRVKQWRHVLNWTTCITTQVGFSHLASTSRRESAIIWSDEVDTRLFLLLICYCNKTNRSLSNKTEIKETSHVTATWKIRESYFEANIEPLTGFITFSSSPVSLITHPWWPVHGS